MPTCITVYKLVSFWMTAALCVGCIARQRQSVGSSTAVRIDGLFKVLDARVIPPNEIKILAKSQINFPPDIDTWERILRRSLGSPWFVRSNLLELCREWDPSFVMQAHRIYRGNSDAWTECRVAIILADKLPDDPLTAEYVLEMTTRLGDASWPAGIDLHGNYPIFIIQRELLPLVWDVPDEVRTTDVRKDLTDWINLISASRANWRFDHGTKKWKSD